MVRLRNVEGDYRNYKLPLFFRSLLPPGHPHGKLIQGTPGGNPSQLVEVSPFCEDLIWEEAGAKCFDEEVELRSELSVDA